MLREQILFKWRERICSASGPHNSTTRLVLLALSNYMAMDGTGAFPSMETLAVNTGLSLRSVKAHIRRARQLGWIEHESKRMKGQKWRRYFYRPRFPIAIEAEKYSAPPFGNEADALEGKGGAIDSRRGEPIAH